MSTLDNGEKPIRVSTLATDLIVTGNRAVRLVSCPRCERMVQVKRHLITVHHFGQHGPCAGSRQRLIYDVDPDDWGARRAGLADLVAQRRPVYSPYSTRPKALPPVPVPLHRIAAA